MPILLGVGCDLFWLLESLRWIDCVAKCSKNAACTKYELTKFKRNFSSLATALSKDRIYFIFTAQINSDKGARKSIKIR